MGVSWVALTLLSAKSMPVYRDARHWPGKACNKVQYTRICYSKGGIYTNIGQYYIYPGTVTARDLEISAHFLQRIYKCQGSTLMLASTLTGGGERYGFMLIVTPDPSAVLHTSS